MIPSQTDLEVNSNISGEVVAMSLDASALRHIMRVLTGLYSDHEFAIIREYTTNARDAHIAAGQARPIEVTTPTPLAPTFKVKDYGVGLSVDDIHNIYSKYGASTKRATNEQTGSLGLGCKSALTYADSFIVIGTKDGVRCQVAVARDADGGGTMTIVDTANTADPNGVEIHIPCKAHNELDRKAREFFAAWPLGSVLLNGTEPERIDGQWISPELCLVDRSQRLAYARHYGREACVVMGGVTYPVNEDSVSSLVPYGQVLYAFVEIGAVDFVPSREELDYTQKTKATLAAISKQFEAKLLASLQAEVDKATDYIEAADTFGRVKKIHAGPYTFRGEQIPESVDKLGDNVETIGRPRYGSRISSSVHYRANFMVRTTELPRILWIEGYDTLVGKWTPTKRKKFDQWLESRTDIPAGWETAVLCDKAPNSKWINRALIFPYADIAAQKLTYPKRGTALPSGRIPASYDIFVDGVRKEGVPDDQFDTTKPIYWSRERWAAKWSEVLAKLGISNTVVYLPANRRDKFHRNFPTASNVEEVVSKHHATWLAGLTDAQRTALKLADSGQAATLKRFDPTRIDDPDLKAAVSAAKFDLTNVEKRRSIYQEVMCLDRFTGAPPPFKRYPLISGTYSLRPSDHIYNYINNAYDKEHRQS